MFNFAAACNSCILHVPTDRTHSSEPKDLFRQIGRRLAEHGQLLQARAGSLRKDMKVVAYLTYLQFGKKIE